MLAALFLQAQRNIYLFVNARKYNTFSFYTEFNSIRNMMRICNATGKRKCGF